jgi:hypothetical protein
VTTLDADGIPAQTLGLHAGGHGDMAATTYRYNRWSNSSRTTQWDPGQDGKCSTATMSSWPPIAMSTTRAASSSRSTVVKAGYRAAWGRERFEYDALGDTTRDVFELAGPDGVVGTQDDVPAHGYAFAYDAQGNPLNTVYNGGGGPGPDGVLFTDDDIIEAWVRHARRRWRATIAASRFDPRRGWPLADPRR